MTAGYAELRSPITGTLHANAGSESGRRPGGNGGLSTLNVGSILWLLGCMDQPVDAPRIHGCLQVHQREKEGIRILDLQGRLTIGPSEAVLRAAVVALADSGTVNVILNLAGVTEIDDDGVGALVFCFAQGLAKSGAALKLLALPIHLNLIVLTELDTVFEVFSDQQDAINSFFPDRATNHYDILNWVQQQEERPPAGLAD